MAKALNNCRFTPTAGGTTDWTVSAAASGSQTPAAAGAVDGQTYRYAAFSADLSQWEIGDTSSASTGTVFARATVRYNSSGTTSKINFSAAPTVHIVPLAEDFREVLFANRNYYVSPNGSDSNTGLATGVTGAVTFTNGSTNVGWSGHALSVGDIFYLSTSGTLPTNFAAPTSTASNLYFVKTVVDANNITVAATSGGTAISAGSAGSGTHTGYKVSPFLNIQKAINTIAALDCSVYAATAYIAAGTFTGGLDTAGVGCELKAVLGSGAMTIIGAGIGTSGTIVAGGADAALWARSAGVWTVAGMKFTSTSYWGFFLTGATVSVIANNIEFGACSVGSINMVGGAKLRLYTHTISGGGQYCYAMDAQASLTCYSITATISGSPVFTSAFVKISGAAYATFEAVTWSGTCGATTPRYNVTQNGILYTAGQATTWLPGTAAHATPTASQGQYI